MDTTCSCSDDSEKWEEKWIQLAVVRMIQKNERKNGYNLQLFG